MKKKIGVLFMIAMCLSACGAEKKDSDHRKDAEEKNNLFFNEETTAELAAEEKEQETEVQNENTASHFGSSSDDREEKNIEKNTVEEGNNITVVENEYGCKLYFADSENYLDVYRQYLMDNLSEYSFNVLIQDSPDETAYYYPYYSPSFCLYDVNGDGKKELIISGALGLRCKMLTAIAFWDGDTFTTREYDGEPVLIGANMISFDDPDYGGAGEEIYDHKYVNLFDSAGVSTTVTEYAAMEKMVEEKEDLSELVYENCWVDGAEVSLDVYTEKENALTNLMKNIEMYELTVENIEKYVTE